MVRPTPDHVPVPSWMLMSYVVSAIVSDLQGRDLDTS